MKRTLRNLLLGTVLALSSCGEVPLYQTTPKIEDCRPGPKCEDGTSWEVSCGYNDSGKKEVVCVDGFLNEGECVGEEVPPPSSVCQNGERKIEYRTPSCGPLTPGFMVEEREKFCENGEWSEFSDWYVTMNCQPPIPECPPPPLCLDGQVEIDWRVRENSCGLNGRGGRAEERSMQCVDGAWNSWSPFSPEGGCYDPDECTDGEIRTSPDACGLNGNGLLTERCETGKFEYISCIDPAECLNGIPPLEVPCGITGVGRSSVICEEGYLTVEPCSVPFVDDVQCLTAETQSRVLPCGGYNGLAKQFQERTRECVDYHFTTWGSWTDLSECIDPDDCVNGSTRTDVTAYCGINSNGFVEQICEVGAWVNSGCDDDAVCRNGEIVAYQVQDIPCGINNRGIQFQQHEQLCVDGQPGEWSTWVNVESCLDNDECLDGTTIQQTLPNFCGINWRGSLTVEYTCREGVYDTERTRRIRCDDPDVCLDGTANDEDTSRTCGLNSRGREVLEREQTCTTGHWGSFSGWTATYACTDVDDCRDGMTRTLNDACGINGRGELDQICTTGNYTNPGVCRDVDVCKDGSLVDYELQNVPCGVEGIQFQEKTQYCVSGQPGTWSSWTNAGSCIVPEVCPPDESVNVPCGINGRGTVAVSCEEGTPMYESCIDTDVCRDGEIIDTDIYDTSCGLNGRGIVVQESIETCVVGHWSLPSLPENRTACFDADECGDGERRAAVGVCGINNNGVLEQTCIEGVWVDGACMDDEVCLNDATLTVNCGYNGRGTTTASCEEGQLTVQLCNDPDICTIGTTRETANGCGLNGRGILEESCVDVRTRETNLTDDDAILGSSDAPATIVEFSDYETPFGARFFSETLPLIKANYIDTGYVKFVFRDFPLSFHPNAQKAAEAAECAGEQGKYWHMHDKLLTEGVSGGVDAFKSYALVLGLDATAFNACLDSGSMVPEIGNDYEDGQAASVIGIPSFFINGQLISGAQPYSVFERAIEEALSRGENWTAWEVLSCRDTDVCVDGTIDISCCGYEGEGTKSRTCIVGSGIWREDSGCTISNLVNFSNNPAPDTEPSLDGSNLIFKEFSTHIMYLDTSAMGFVLPERINDHITTPSGGDVWSSGDWSINYCTDLGMYGNNVVFKCDWRDTDWFFDDYSYDHVYLLEKTGTDFSERKHLRGLNPSVASTQFSFRESANIKVYNNTTGTLVRDFGNGRGFPDIDGDYVVFEKDNAGKTRIYLGKISTGATTLISGVGTNDSGFQPSIDGNDVVFYSERDASKQLYHYDLESSSLQQLTNCNNNYEPSVSEGKVAFTSERDGLPNKEVYVCDIAAATASGTTDYCCSNATNISNSPSADYTPSISGCKVAFTSERDGNKEIYVYDMCEGGCEEEE